VTTVYAVPNSSIINAVGSVEITVLFPSDNALYASANIYIGGDETPATPTIEAVYDNSYYQIYCPNAGVTNYSWNSGQLTSDMNEPIINPGLDGTSVTVTLQTKNACGLESLTTTRYFHFPGHSGYYLDKRKILDTITLASKIKIFPVPADKFIDIQINDSSSNVYFKVCDIFGSIVKKTGFGNIENENIFQINTSDFVPGIYIVQIYKNKKYIKSLKFAVVHH